MSVIVHDSGHLRRLRSLRAEVDQAIKVEEARLERAARVRASSPRPVRRPEPTPPPAPLPRRGPPPGSSAAIREWAVSQGIPVGARGSIRAELRREYELAHAQPLGSVNEG